MFDLEIQSLNFNQSYSILSQIFEFKEKIFMSQNELIVLLISIATKEKFYNFYPGIQKIFDYYFTEREKNEYLIKKKKYFWLYGRLLAKNAIKRILKYSNFGNYHDKEIQILNDSPNKPILKILKVKNNQKIYFSISHSYDKIVAISSLNQIGIDIEKIRNFSSHLLLKFLNPKDILKIFHYFTGNGDLKAAQNEIYTTLWCIKEAVLKASEQGLRLNFRDLEFNFNNNKIFIKNFNENEIYNIKTLKEGNYIIAIAEKLN